MHGRIAAGTPIEALQGTEGFAVPAALSRPGEIARWKCPGNSMVEEGILDGDFALDPRSTRLATARSLSH